MCQYFRVIKSARRRGPRLVQYLSILLNERTKTTPKYLSSMLFFLASRHTAQAEMYGSTHDASLTRNSCRNIEAERTYTARGACVDVSYVNTTWIQVFFLFIFSFRLFDYHILEATDSATNPSGVQIWHFGFVFLARARPNDDIRNFSFSHFFFFIICTYNNEARRLIWTHKNHSELWPWPAFCKTEQLLKEYFKYLLRLIAVEQMGVGNEVISETSSVSIMARRIGNLNINMTW